MSSLKPNSKEIQIVALALKQQYDLVVRMSGVGELSLMVHLTAVRIANNLQEHTEGFDMVEFLELCGVRTDEEVERVLTLVGKPIKRKQLDSLLEAK